MVITVECPSCQTSFPVDTMKVPEAGVHARCSHCQGVFFVERPAEPAAERLDVEPVGASVAASDTAVATPAEAAPAEAEAEEGSATTDVTEDEAFSSPGAALAEVLPAEEADEPTPAASREEPALREDSAAEATATEPTFELKTDDPATAAPSVGEAAPPTPPAPQPAPSASPSSFSFGRRDPHEKARRLARVLVSDMIMYNPERHSRALENGSLKDDFQDEIKKSWEEYVDQVGDEIAGSTNYFNDALNDILAKGRSLFP